MRNFRPLATSFIVLAIIFLPYWIYVPALVLAMAALPLYWESILLAFLISALYGGHWHDFNTIIFSPAFLAMCGLLLLIPLRKRLRNHV